MNKLDHTIPMAVAAGDTVTVQQLIGTQAIWNVDYPFSGDLLTTSK